MIDFLLRNGIEIPGYFTLAEIIGDITAIYRKGLAETIEKSLTLDNRILLDSFFERDVDEKFQRYNLTLFKKFNQSTKPAKVKENIEDHAVLNKLFHSLESVINKLNLTDESIEYYAQSVLKFQTAQLTRSISNGVQLTQK